jgi:hypothetical protein
LLELAGNRETRGMIVAAARRDRIRLTDPLYEHFIDIPERLQT